MTTLGCRCTLLPQGERPEEEHQPQRHPQPEQQRPAEEEGKEPAVHLEGQVKHPDERKLARREEEQRRHQNRVEHRHVEDPDLDHREDHEHGGHAQVDSGRGVRVRRGRVLRRHCSSDAHWIRYTTVKITIQITSTKCQYRPQISTVTALAAVSWPWRARTQRVSSHTTPTVTWAPCVPVRTKNVAPKRFVWSVSPSRTNDVNS